MRKAGAGFSLLLTSRRGGGGIGAAGGWLRGSNCRSADPVLGLFGLDLAAQRRRTISRCQRRIVPEVMNECSAPWRERGMSVSGAANSARSVHVSLGRAAVCCC